MAGKRNRKSLDPDNEKASPPSKMSFSESQSKSDEILAKLNLLEERFLAVENQVAELTRVLKDMESVKEEVESLKATCSGLQRLELEAKKRSILVKGLPLKAKGKY